MIKKQNLFDTWFILILLYFEQSWRSYRVTRTWRSQKNVRILIFKGLHLLILKLNQLLSSIYVATASRTICFIAYSQSLRRDNLLKMLIFPSQVFDTIYPLTDLAMLPRFSKFPPVGTSWLQSYRVSHMMLDHRWPVQSVRSSIVNQWRHKLTVDTEFSRGVLGPFISTIPNGK